MTANTPQTRKAKGRRFQQWIAEQIGTLLNIPVGKDKDIESREMGQSGVDIKLYGKAKKLFPFDIEAKAQENMSVPAWIKQAESNKSKDSKGWLLFCKQSRKEPIVILDAKLFFSIYKDILKYKRK